ALLIVDIMVERQVVTVINTHFDLDVESRAKSIKVLERELENIDNPIIFMGDLNMTEREDSLTYIAENLLTPVSDIGLPQFSFPSNNPNRQIDWIFVSEDIGYKDFKVINSSFSDHCPLSVLVNIPE
ncbi:MAG: endonuclease/exonuclease/phosphatase family protein, partial [Clostridia bacterium]|nr:endonuclease/exonuclease/phosphatase family protein [Clostridia bacterium]